MKKNHEKSRVCGGSKLWLPSHVHWRTHLREIVRNNDQYVTNYLIGRFLSINTGFLGIAIIVKRMKYIRPTTRSPIEIGFVIGRALFWCNEKVTLHWLLCVTWWFPLWPSGSPAGCPLWFLGGFRPSPISWAGGLPFGLRALRHVAVCGSLVALVSMCFWWLAPLLK